ncbi:MAG: molybdopterin-dependent oxidoreductase, partial [Pseudomonadota bacterium]
VLNPECDIEIPMPVEKALDPDTILALEMNGAPLPADHGYPVRMVVPGWIGTYWVKWVGWLTVSRAEIRNYRTDEYYVIGGKTVTQQNIKSALSLPWPAEVPAGPRHFHGFARCPGQMIERVEWSVDDLPWREAEILSPNTRWGWVRFGFDWEAAPGMHHIRTRATDTAGQAQPDCVPFNPGTMLYNAIIPHPVAVG